LILSVVNATESPQQFDLGISGVRANAAGKAWQLTANSVDAANRVGQTPGVAVTEHSVSPNLQSVSIAPISINIYQFPVSEIH